MVEPPIVCEPGCAEIVKLGGGGAVTTSVAVTECAGAPPGPVPVTWKLYEPAPTVDGTVSVSVEAVEAGFGEKDAVAAPGSPLVPSVTGPANEPMFVTVTV